ncbi:RB1-inducible coiled-coil protein 1-like [Antedon mediterranea]|uniref:RB1-inducible coiled-coil protein 1-like n=1 Tax=Antedon mediterranea TaxID=105859 RepID=UPI003AF47389
MLHIFVVNTGTMVTMDMSHTMRSVLDLQHAIHKEYGIAVDKQVLLVSGGQSLDVQQRVCTFNAGTDTNPIYLFDKSLIEQANYQHGSSLMEDDQQQLDNELKEQVEAFRHLPPSYNAVSSRTQMALQLHDRAKEKVQSCENVVRDQHQQQQGWMAVVANLEDISRAFKLRTSSFENSLTDFMSKREDYFKMLSEFPDVLNQLERIPLPSNLVDSARLESESDRDSMTLMRWISRQDERSSLVNMYQLCAKSLEQFEPNTLHVFSSDINDVKVKVDNPGMKEIKGLGDRLFGLEQLLAQAKKTRQDQGEMAQSFVQNQTRISNLRDTSVLPQLCDSHQKQLVVMIKNHLQLREISRRCLIAKKELCQNLHVRLRWIMFVEQQITGIHGKMVVYHENLKRLKKRLEIAQQVYNAPELFAKALVEIYLRRQFDFQFSQKFGAVSELQLREVDRRKEFSAIMHSHFLNAMFPGLGNLPPGIMLEPLVSDTILPTVSLEDIKLLKDHVPELEHCLQFPDEGLSKETQTVDELPNKDWEKLSMRDVLIKQQQIQYSDKETTPTANREEEIYISHIDDRFTDEFEKNSKQPIEESVETLKNEPFEDNLEDDILLENGGPLSVTGITIGSHSNLKMDPPFGALLSTNTDNFLSTQDSVEMPFYSLAGNQLQSVLPKPLIGTEFTNKIETLEDELEDLKRENEDKERKLKISERLEVEIRHLQQEIQDATSKFNKLENEKEQISKQNVSLTEKVNESKNVLLSETKSIRGELTNIKDDFSSFLTDNRTAVVQLETHVKLISKEYERTQVDNANLLEEMKQEKENKLKEENVFQRKYEHLLQEHECYIKQNDEKHEMMDKDIKEKETLLEKMLKEKEKLEIVQQELSLQIQKENELKKQLEKSQQDLTNLNKQKQDLKDEYGNSLEESKRKLESQLEDKNQEIIRLRLSQEVEISDLRLIVKDKEQLIDQLKDGKEEMLKQKSEEKEQLVLELESKKSTELKEFENNLRKQWEEEIKAMSIENLIAIKPDIKSEAIIRKENEESLKGLQKQLEETHKKDLNVRLEELKITKDEEIAVAKQTAHSEIEELLEKYKICEEKYHTLQKDSVKQTNQMEASFMTEKQCEVLAALEEERKNHKLKMDKLRQNMEESQKNAIKDVLDDAELRHSREIQEMMKTFDKEKQSSLDDMKTSIQADKQVHFNTALSKLSVEKDKEIETLKKKIAEFEKQRQMDKEAIDKLLTENCDISDIVKQTISERALENQKLKDENESLLKSKQDLMDLQVRGSGSSSMEESVLYMQKSIHSDSSTLEDQASGGHRLTKAKENTDFRKRMVDSTSKAEKISIIDIGVGDLVLIFFEEPHDNYVVFTRGQTHYFVHADSLTGLGLKPHDPSKRAWIIGRITDKEYCQAKKAQNRFKVPVGTKFYRVKAELCSIKDHRRTKVESKT